jgi:hypothetical protein
VESFRARLQAVPHGGQYVVVPDGVAKNAGVRHGQRVRGTVNGAPYRSSVMKYSGTFHLGVHKATLAAAGVAPGVSVSVSIEPDDEPLPTDTVPPDFATALAKNRTAKAAWSDLRPSRRRELVKGVLTAKKPDTRARRIAAAIAELAAPAPERKGVRATKG